MPDVPLLTIGIPHLDRTEHLVYAIESALAQTVPVHIIVADQGKTEKTRKFMARYCKHPHIQHELTEADCLWANWESAARACDTKYFAWLQDDDEIAPIYADRVIQAFEAFPDALHFQASCYVTPDRVHIVRRGWNGPQVGVNKRLIPEVWFGELCVAPMYIMSWALSPGVAFRCGEEFNAALSNMPNNCDLFNERIILAEMGSRGRWVADPMTAGYWYHHGLNESYTQNATPGVITAQTKVLVDCLDNICDRTPDWDKALTSWCRMQSPQEVVSWLNGCSDDKGNPTGHPIAISRHCDAIQAAMVDSLQGRVEWGGVKVPAPVEDELVLTFE